MSNWVEMVEDGQVYYVNEDVGNILKVAESMYIAMMPKVLKLGPFSSLEDAKAAFDRKKEIDDLVTQYNTNNFKKV